MLIHFPSIVSEPPPKKQRVLYKDEGDRCHLFMKQLNSPQKIQDKCYKFAMEMFGSESQLKALFVRDCYSPLYDKVMASIEQPQASGEGRQHRGVLVTVRIFSFSFILIYSKLIVYLFSITI